MILIAAVLGWRLVAIYQPPPIVPGHTVFTSGPAGVNAGRLYLAFQGGSNLKTCAALATKLNFSLFCPNLLPTDATMSGHDCCIYSNPNVAPLFVLESHFTASRGYPGAEPLPVALGTSKEPHGHFLLIATRQSPSASALSCASPQGLGEGPQVGGQHSFWQFCPGDLGGNAHHLILAWEFDVILYSISLHGDTPDNRLAIELMALNLQLVPPRGF